jgi:hypothetical protein
LCHLSLLLLNTSSMFSGPGCPNTVAGSIGSCLASCARRAGESVQLGASKFSSAESSSSESVWISGSSICSPFWYRGEDLAADFAPDLAPPFGAPGRAGVLWF